MALREERLSDSTQKNQSGTIESNQSLKSKNFKFRPENLPSIQEEQEVSLAGGRELRKRLTEKLRYILNGDDSEGSRDHQTDLRFEEDKAKSYGLEFGSCFRTGDKELKECLEMDFRGDENLRAMLSELHQQFSTA